MSFPNDHRASTKEELREEAYCEPCASPYDEDGDLHDITIVQPDGAAVPMCETCYDTYLQTYTPLGPIY